jgi:hypothetical protein
MAQQSKQIRDTFSATELPALNEHKLNEICQQLDQLSFHWRRLEIGQSMAVSWPNLAIVDFSEEAGSDRQLQWRHETHPAVTNGGG